MWSPCPSLQKDWRLRPMRVLSAPVCLNLIGHHWHQLVQSRCWKMLVKRWVCVGLEEEVWRAWVVGGAASPLMTLRETQCFSLTSGHREKAGALHRPQRENCLYSALWNNPH